MKTFTPEEIAKVTHQANQALREILGEEGNNPSWDDASYDQRESVRIGVVGIMEGNTPEQSHQLWLDTKAAQGWTYGEVKDEAAKTHPCFVPYDELPPEQKLKYHLFSAIIKTFVGFEYAHEHGGV